MGVWTSRPRSMFGGKISDHLDNDDVNKFVRWSVEQIERTGQGLRTDALYRASGGHDDVQRIRGQPERGMQELLSQETNVHVLTGALKQFFRSLKQPILSIEEFQKVLEGRENGNDTSDRLVEIINNTPKQHRPTLAFFFKHLFRVMHEEDNNMSLASLGVVFGPTLMRVASSAFTEDVATAQARIEDLNLVVELLLQHYSKAFNDHQPPSCTSSSRPAVASHDSTSEELPSPNQQSSNVPGTAKHHTTHGSNSHVDDEELPSRNDSDNQQSYDISDTAEHLSSSHHEPEEVGSGVAADAVDNQQPSDVRDDLEGASRTSESKETPSLVTLMGRTTRSSTSDDPRRESVQSTGRRHEETAHRCSLDDPMSKSSDSDDIYSVLAHIAKALSPEQDHYKSSDVTASSDATAAPRASCDVDKSPYKTKNVTASSDEPSRASCDVDKSLGYLLSAPRITIIERDRSTAAGGETCDVTEGDMVESNNTMWSVEEKIRMFTKHGENVSSSLKKQKVVGNQESEEEKQVKSEFEKTYEKVTQQKSN